MESYINIISDQWEKNIIHDDNLMCTFRDYGFKSKLLTHRKYDDLTFKEVINKSRVTQTNEKQVLRKFLLKVYDINQVEFSFVERKHFIEFSNATGKYYLHLFTFEKKEIQGICKYILDFLHPFANSMQAKDDLGYFYYIFEYVCLQLTPL